MFNFFFKKKHFFSLDIPKIKKMIKKIFIYWNNGFSESPDVVKKCLISWKLKNLSWEIIELDNTNLTEYINIEQEIPTINQKNISWTSYSDIIRIFILEKYGGCWCDATTFCVNSLDRWLEETLDNTSFFAFSNNLSKKGKDKKILSSWFLYGEPGSYILKKWKQSVIDYWNNLIIMDNYFWFHILFYKLSKSDVLFKNTWSKTPKISNKPSHFLKRKGLMNPITSEIKKHIKKQNTPIYKLTYKLSSKNNNENSILNYLLNTIQLRFIHIPKNGGSSIEEAAKKKDIKFGKYDNKLIEKKKPPNTWHTPQKTSGVCFCVIRCPYDKLISQFYNENPIASYTQENLNKFLKKRMKDISKNIHLKDNHYLEQSKFYQHCKIAISMENLQENLNKLMKLFNLPSLELDKLPGGLSQQKKRRNHTFKRLNKDNINITNLDLINKKYHQDFVLWENVKKKGILFKL